MPLRHAEYGVATGNGTPGIAHSHDLPVLRAPRAPRRRVARRRHQGRHPATARVPVVRAALHHLRAVRGDAAGGGEVVRRAPVRSTARSSSRASSAPATSGRCRRPRSRWPCATSRRELRNRLRQEVSSPQIGELALRRLKEIDPVAYVRFASVYRQVRRRRGVRGRARAARARAAAAPRTVPSRRPALPDTRRGLHVTRSRYPQGTARWARRGRRRARPPRRQPMATDAPPTMTDRALGITRRFTRRGRPPLRRGRLGPARRAHRRARPGRQARARRLRAARLRVPARLVRHRGADRRLQVLPLRHGRPAP